MKPSIPFIHWFVPVVALGLAVGACADGPAEPLAGEPEFNHAGNHPANPGAGVTISILQQPDVFPNPGDASLCNYTYAFEIDGKKNEKKKQIVTWAANLVGGDHHGDLIGGDPLHQQEEVGGRSGAVQKFPTAAHPNDGHTFVAIEITVREYGGGQFLGAVLAQTQTTGGGTFSC